MTNSDRWFSTPTQVFWTCKALLEGREITHKTEIREVKGWRLAAIIERLRKHYHWPIETVYRGPENLAHYRLKPGTDAAKLQFPPSAKALSQGVEP